MTAFSVAFYCPIPTAGENVPVKKMAKPAGGQLELWVTVLAPVPCGFFGQGTGVPCVPELPMGLRSLNPKQELVPSEDSAVLGSCGCVPGPSCVISYRDEMNLFFPPQAELSLPVLDHLEPLWSFEARIHNPQVKHITLFHIFCVFFYKQQPGVLNLIINYKT